MAELKIPEGYRKTKQREAILKILERAEYPISAEQIFMELKKKGIDISLSTIYRNLEMLTKEGLVVKSYMINEDKARYALPDKKNYLVCEKCGKIVIIDNCPFDKFKEELIEVHGFDITGHSIEVYGICPECQKK
ncbi:Fur family transcriptional regulator, ferric uptake regulator [Persephonella hydrogeniphila]|uniref:Fur family transcriptional regulator, ferric uptake regulator n=1 Tax=Persephonella hydrogeniphila TaxID=198703 RepID=A0A285NK03_9AQUI|nr:transcriptional repressor [Persephonella hydrogeniphila]SNZ08206.1 Fur family transcriptional regulator, ferric uptake regulator [Persephonella hydrogeniphila]